MYEVLRSYIAENWVEVTGSILSLIYIYLSVNRKIGLWIFGFLSSALYIVVFFSSKFYADMTLQFYYLAVSVYGLINWKRGSGADSGHELPVVRLQLKQGPVLLAATLVVFVAYYLVLKSYTDSPMPFGDSATTALCVVGTWMLARKILENWLFFILADAVCVGLYVYKQLYPTAILFAIYTVMAFVGYYRWKKTLCEQS